MKLQSALEYLSTHIWAILIIAIIFISLYGLGLFNSNSYAPKASPGACTVQRGYDTQPTLAGQCLNDMPEFVEYFQGGAGANVALPDPKLYWGDSNSFTVNLWTDYFNSNVNFQSAAVKGSSVLVFAIFQHGNCCAPYVQAIEYTGI
ncbi:MAG: hypothetical protein KGH62_04765, partial [Candidatus Micrarchaeota archaeon]|nr:hypothetical protein [Candidatus Micrarchaeota archaeon]